MLPRNKREKDLILEVQHKWVYKDIFKLTPSTASGKFITKKKKKDQPQKFKRHEVFS